MASPAMGIDVRLETPRQLAARVGLTIGQVRGLIATGRLEHVMIGSRVHIPNDAFARFLETQRVKTCQDETKGPASDGSLSVTAFTSLGPNTAAAASARQARQIASKLKRPSENGSKPEADAVGRVIPLSSS